MRSQRSIDRGLVLLLIIAALIVWFLGGGSQSSAAPLPQTDPYVPCPRVQENPDGTINVASLQASLDCIQGSAQAAIDFARIREGSAQFFAQEANRKADAAAQKVDAFAGRVDYLLARPEAPSGAEIDQRADARIQEAKRRWASPLASWGDPWFVNFIRQRISRYNCAAGVPALDPCPATGIPQP